MSPATTTATATATATAAPSPLTLVREYGHGNWRKVKGVATIRLENGTVIKAELHWYEAHGIGRKELKFKKPL